MESLHSTVGSHPVFIGPFRVIRTLGVGGLGTVYLGERAEQFAQRVAIKILHQHFFVDDSLTGIWHEEQILASLEHENIVRLLDHGLAQ